MQQRFDRALADPPKASQPELKPEPEPKKGLLRRLSEYRKKGVLGKVVKQKLYRITPLRKAVHGAKRLFKRK